MVSQISLPPSILLSSYNTTATAWERFMLDKPGLLEYNDNIAHFKFLIAQACIFPSENK